MPELPEVETVVRTLEHLIQGRQIVKTRILYSKIVEAEPELFCQTLLNHHFLNFSRRGKYLLFEMEDLTLIAHLRMEGKFYLKKQGEDYDKHTHLQFDLDDGTRLDYHDTRKFGRMEIVMGKLDLKHFKNLGPEPFWPEFNPEYVRGQFEHCRTALKTKLLDQSFVAGIGNIYADEICYALRLHPLTPVNQISKIKRNELPETVRRILRKAIEAGGSTVRSYTSSLGVTGLFQLELEAYGRENEPCRRCNTALKRIVIGQRSSCFCPKCQRKRWK